MQEKQKDIVKNFKFIMRELYHYRKYSILLPLIGMIAQILLSLITIYMPKAVLDMLEQKVEMCILVHNVLMLGAVLACALLWNLAAHNEIVSCSQTFLYKRLIPSWERAVMGVDFQVLTSQKGKILTEQARNVVSSPNWGVVFYLPRLTGVLENLTGLLAYGAIVGMLHPMILLMLILMFVLEMYAAAVTERKKHSLQDEQAGVNRRMNYLAYKTKGMVEGKDIRIYTMTAWLREIAGQVIRQKEAVEGKAAGFQAKRLALTGILILLRDAVAYSYLIYCFFKEEMSVGDFTFYFAAITGLGSWLSGLAESLGQFFEVNHYVGDLRRFLELPREDVSKRDEGMPIEFPVALTLEDVSFSYVIEGEEKQEIPVLKHLNLTIHAGEKLAIVGVNGAGKTTLVKLLCGLLCPTEGRILINGRDSAEIPREQYFRLFSAVFQSAGVLPVSIADNIMLNVGEERDEALMWECLRQAGLEQKVLSLPNKERTCLVKRIAEQGTDFSGGQQQRLLLARALYKKAPVLILDEPTAALDPLAESKIYEKYNQFTDGRTAIFISHRLASTRFCDRILLLEQGEIREMGTHVELLEKGGRYAEMFQVQSRYYQKASGEAGGLV